MSSFYRYFNFLTCILRTVSTNHVVSASYTTCIHHILITLQHFCFIVECILLLDLYLLCLRLLCMDSCLENIHILLKLRIVMYLLSRFYFSEGLIVSSWSITLLGGLQG